MTGLSFEVASALQDAIKNRNELPRIERERYRAAGWQVIDPGTPRGCDFHFKTRDWRDDSFLAQCGRVVEISLIWARVPGTGAFGRLRSRLEQDGYDVRIVCPLGRFAESLIAQGYVVHVDGSTFADRRAIYSRQ